MITLYRSVDEYLKTPTKVMNFESNNIFTRITTLLLFLSRLLIFNYCLNVANCAKTFTSKRWTLLQLYPDILFQDIFNTLFLQLLKFQYHDENEIVHLVSELLETVKDQIIKQECLPKINDVTYRFLVINDQAHFLADQFQGSFQSTTTTSDSLRPLLAPILHGFERLGESELLLISCGNNSNIDTVFWVQNSSSVPQESGLIHF